jgi:uncharacterized protein YjbJ (UPF0337 family)
MRGSARTPAGAPTILRWSRALRDAEVIMKSNDTMQNAKTVLADVNVHSTLHAANGDDAKTSAPPPVLPTLGELKGRWQQYVGAAKVTWGKLTEDELMKIEGHAQQLVGLIQERYAVSLHDAQNQVKAFYTKHKI